MPKTVALTGLVTAAAWAHAAPVTLTTLKPHKVNVEQTTYKGKSAIRVTDAPDPKAEGDDRVAVLTNTSFGDGTIEIEVAGQPASGASEGARGFIGIAFCVDRTFRDSSVLFAAYQRSC